MACGKLSPKSCANLRDMTKTQSTLTVILVLSCIIVTVTVFSLWNSFLELYISCEPHLYIIFIKLFSSKYFQFSYYRKRLLKYSIIWNYKFKAILISWSFIPILKRINTFIDIIISESSAFIQYFTVTISK